MDVGAPYEDGDRQTCLSRRRAIGCQDASTNTPLLLPRTYGVLVLRMLETPEWETACQGSTWEKMGDPTRRPRGPGRRNEESLGELVRCYPAIHCWGHGTCVVLRVVVLRKYDTSNGLTDRPGMQGIHCEQYNLGTTCRGQGITQQQYRAGPWMLHACASCTR